jgi:hypothetical protein
MLEHREDPSRSHTEYRGAEPKPQPRLPNNTELFILGMLILWLVGTISANR